MRISNPHVEIYYLLTMPVYIDREKCQPATDAMPVADVGAVFVSS